LRIYFVINSFNFCNLHFQLQVSFWWHWSIVRIGGINIRGCKSRHCRHNMGRGQGIFSQL